MPARHLLLLTLGLIASGCLGGDGPRVEDDDGGSVPTRPATATGATAAPAADGDGDGEVAGPRTVLTACRHTCFEPTVAVDAAGRTFATTVAGERIAVISPDGNLTLLAPPPAAAGVPPPPPEAVWAASGLSVPTMNRSDAIVQIAPDGRLFYSAMVGYAQGTQVAWSADAGGTWAGNVFVPPQASADAAAPLPGRIDRQWLGFAPDGTVYLVYTQIPTGVWIARSTDGGSSFSAFARVAGTEEGTIGAGPPVVDAAGRVFIPHLRGHVYSTSVDLPVENAIVVSVSEDGGRTFEPHVVARTTNGRPPSVTVPVAAVTDAGALSLAWVAPEGAGHHLRVATSHDHGRTFLPPRTWSADAGVEPSILPALVAGNDTLHAAWFERGDERHLRLVHARADAAAAGGDEAVRTVVVDGAVPPWTPQETAATDFVSLDLDPRGRAVLAWTRGESVVVHVVANA